MKNKSKLWRVFSALLAFTFLVSLPLTVFATGGEEPLGSHTVTYNMTYANGGTGTEEVVVETGAVSPAPTTYIPQAGYQWTAAENGTEAFAFPTITDNTTIALFETTIPQAGLSVHYNVTLKDGSSAVETVNVADDGTYPLPTHTLHTGYQWTATADGTTAYVFPGTVTENTTITLFETEIPSEETADPTVIAVTPYVLNADGRYEGGASVNISIDADGTVDSSALPVASTEPAITGWASSEQNAKDGEALVFSRDALSNNMGLYAIYANTLASHADAPTPEPQEYTLSFYTKMFSSSVHALNVQKPFTSPSYNTRDYQEGEAIELPDVADLTSAFFAGWGTSNDGGTTITPVTLDENGKFEMPSADTNIYAIYTPFIEYDIQSALSADGLTETLTITVTPNPEAPGTVITSLGDLSANVSQSSTTTVAADGSQAVGVYEFNYDNFLSGPNKYVRATFKKPNGSSTYIDINFSISANIQQPVLPVMAEFDADAQKISVTALDDTHENVQMEVLHSQYSNPGWYTVTTLTPVLQNGVYVVDYTPAPGMTSGKFRFRATSDQLGQGVYEIADLELYEVNMYTSRASGNLIESRYTPKTVLMNTLLPQTEEAYEAFSGETLDDGVHFGAVTNGGASTTLWIYWDETNSRYASVASNTSPRAASSYYPLLSYEVTFVDGADETVLRTGFMLENNAVLSVHSIPELPADTLTHVYFWEGSDGAQYTSEEIGEMNFSEPMTFTKKEIERETALDYFDIEFRKVYDMQGLEVTNSNNEEDTNDIRKAFLSANPTYKNEALYPNLSIDIVDMGEVGYGADTYAYAIPAEVRWTVDDPQSVDYLTEEHIERYVMTYQVLAGEGEERSPVLGSDGEALIGNIYMAVYPRPILMSANGAVSITGSNFPFVTSAYSGEPYFIQTSLPNDRASASVYSWYNGSDENEEGVANVPRIQNKETPFLELDDYKEVGLVSNFAYTSPSIQMLPALNELYTLESGDHSMRFAYPEDQINLDNYYIYENYNDFQVRSARDYENEKPYDDAAFTITAEDVWRQMGTEGILYILNLANEGWFYLGDAAEIGVRFWDEETESFSATEYTTPSENVGEYTVPFKVLVLNEAGEPVNADEATAAKSQTNAYTATLNITPIPLTYTVADASKVAGEADPSFTASLTGGTIMGDDDVAPTVTRTNNDEAAGSYADVLEVTGLTGNDAGNYTIVSVPGDFTITAAPVVTPDDEDTTPPVDDTTPPDDGDGVGGTVDTTPATTAPVAVAPAAPAAVLAPVAAPAAPAALVLDLPDADIPLAAAAEDVTLDIGDTEVPLADFGGSWSLVDLLLTVVTGLMSISLLIGYFVNKKAKEEDEENAHAQRSEDEDNTRLKRKGGFRLFSIIPMIGAIVLFILTQDLTLPMTLFDNWTIFFAIVTLIQVLTMILSRKKRVEDEEDETGARA